MPFHWSHPLLHLSTSHSEKENARSLKTFPGPMRIQKAEWEKERQKLKKQKTNLFESSREKGKNGIRFKQYVGVVKYWKECLE